jgi:hypothetical protein
MPELDGRVLDRRIPTDFDHVVKFPGRALRSMQRTVDRVEKIMKLPTRYHAFYDQGQEGACVGFGQSIMMSLINRKLYDGKWLYDQAQLVDEWDDTPPEEGTSLRAGFDILRTKGHRRVYAGSSKPPEVDEGIVDVNRWITSVDEARTAISEDMPVNLGLNWYNSFYRPDVKAASATKSEYVIAGDERAGNWGSIAGGHDITIAGASDRRQAFALLNSWGEEYPWPVWLPYKAFARLMAEQGEAAIVTDK